MKRLIQGVTLQAPDDAPMVVQTAHRILQDHQLEQLQKTTTFSLSLTDQRPVLLATEREPGTVYVEIHVPGQPGGCFYDGPGECWTEDRVTWTYAFPVRDKAGWKWRLET